MRVGFVSTASDGVVDAIPAEWRSADAILGEWKSDDAIPADESSLSDAGCFRARIIGAGLFKACFVDAGSASDERRQFLFRRKIGKFVYFSSNLLMIFMILMLKFLMLKNCC